MRQNTVMHMLGAVLIAVGLIIFAPIARHGTLVLIAISAFAVALITVVIDLIRLRHYGHLRYDETPRGVLQQAKDRNAAQQRGVDSAGRAAIILAVAALLALIFAVTQWPTYTLALPLGTLWAISSLCVWLWHIRSRHRLVAEWLALDTALREFEEIAS
jgi:amino acid transporter